MIYYSSSLIKKENKSIWYYASYDLMYGEEVGIGVSLTILNKKRKKLTKKKKIHSAGTLVHRYSGING